MIQAKELRFGNKVQTRQGEVITVQQILCNTLIYDTQIEVTENISQSKGSHKTAYTAQLNEVVKEVYYQELDPIALTPEILEKCGFRNFMREEWIFSFEKHHLDFEYTNEGLRLKRPAPTPVSIKYLHQLQNFLYTIADHELEAAV